ncbi:hypothetical protein L1987_70877 [Smallanthus sonchifolius]|uniref:Uncharacterized protein n=1 Tax=Smallanthus sonchifolius TaxID=185202 RepID=A0ACB9AQT5_9ASTR|nr:hypothetical protein L1987_70877 [Smallanthus sonchifolius]
MEEQTIQPVPEVIDGNLVEEIETNTEEAEVKKEDVRMEDEKDDDEEFYERIEAPKFVDFTKPYTVRTDDRYWFCSRVGSKSDFLEIKPHDFGYFKLGCAVKIFRIVTDLISDLVASSEPNWRFGCDQKHEEEINPEEISKNFVLRVLAARSPNIKLRKALNREHARIKCPLSAPAKPSKPRIPRFAMVSDKNGDPQSKTGSCSKVRSTPVVKSRQVAAKYMTTPRNKVCHPNPNSFRSVQNPKTTTVDVPKNRTVAKALVFRSPKKAIILKKSVELHTPLTKICEGMKRLAIASQKKTLKGSVTKPKKPETEESSRKQLKICRSEKKSKDLAPSKCTKTQNKKTPTYKCHSLHEQVLDVKLSDGSTSEFIKKEDSHPHETSDISNSHALRDEMKDLSNIEDKENMVNAEEHSNEVEVGSRNEQIDDGSASEFIKKEHLRPHETSDTSNSHASRAETNDFSNIEDKENMVSAEDHSNEVEVGFRSEQIDDGKDALNPQNDNRSNNQPLGDKILNKEILKKNKVVQTAAPGVTKCKKPKPTSIKPFRLRTDERGILKEAILEKKLHVSAPKKEVAKDTSVIKMTFRVLKNEKFSRTDNCAKESGPSTERRRPESTQQRSKTSLKTRSQRVVPVRMPHQQLGVI